MRAAFEDLSRLHTCHTSELTCLSSPEEVLILQSLGSNTWNLVLKSLNGINSGKPVRMCEEKYTYHKRSVMEKILSLVT